ncbi:MAG: hypothetical protein R2772_11825 [Chitinophagales bacterium]
MGIPLIKMVTLGILPSFLKKAYYRSKGAKIGEKVNIGLFSIIDADVIEIGDYSKIAPMSFIKARVCKLGKRTSINTLAVIDTYSIEVDDDSTIMEQVVIGGMLTPRSKIVIGKRVKIFPYSFLNPTEEIVIEDDVGIGGSNYIFTHGSWQSELDGFPVAFGPVRIKKGTWFPWRVFVMPGVTVGEYCTIGAGSVITKNIPSNSLAAGSPAKVLREEGSYLKKLSVDEKNNKVMGYLSEFVEFMIFQGKQCVIEKISDTHMEIRLHTDSKRQAIICYQMIDNGVSEADLYICLGDIARERKDELSKKGKVYFDIFSKETVFRDLPEWYLIRDYFSRYGVRFNVVD